MWFELEETSGISEQRIYELPGEVSRSSDPDERNLVHEGSSTCSSNRHSKKSRWRHNVNAYQAPSGKNRKTCLRQLMLEWGKEGSNGLIFNIAPPRASANVEAPNYISWQYGPSQPEIAGWLITGRHSEYDDMRLMDLEASGQVPRQFS